MIFKIKWKAKYKLCLIDDEDSLLIANKKWQYYHYKDYIGYHLQTSGKERIKKLTDLIIGNYDKQKYSIIHLNKNCFDCRKKNLLLVTSHEKNCHKDIITEEGIKLLNEYNDIIKGADYTVDIIKFNLKEVPESFQEIDYTIKIPKLKEINIANLIIDESIKPYLFYHPQKNDKSDYFYLIGHPIVLEKLKKRRYQGTKDKNINTIEKYNLLLKTIEELNNI
jgi:hypothetical protein